MTPENKKVAIIDGHYLMHRLGHDQKTSSLRTKSGVNTGIVFNTIRILNNIIKNDSFDQILFVMDKARSNRRLSIYPLYKDRSPDPDIIEHEPDPVDEVNGKDYLTIFNEQMGLLQTLLPAMKVRVVKYVGEGDDICWILANEFSRMDNVSSIVIFSDDHDYSQMLTIPKVSIDRPIAGERLDLSKAEKKYGVPIKLFPAYKAICGDGSDNIPQIAKQFGGASALKLVNWLTSVGINDTAELMNILKKGDAHEFLQSAGTPRVNLVTPLAVQNLIRNIELVDLRYVLDEFDDQDISNIMCLAQEQVEFNRSYVFEVFKELEFKSLTEVFVNPNFRRLV